MFFPFASISLRLLPDSVGSDALNTTRHGVDNELAFHTTDQGIYNFGLDFLSVSFSGLLLDFLHNPQIQALVV